MDITQNNSFADITSEESETINGAGNSQRCYSSSRYPKPSHIHYRDTLRILYPDVMVVRSGYHRGSQVDRYYF